MGYRIANGEALLQQTWDAALTEESQEGDILAGMTGTYSESNQKVPDSAIMRVMLKAGANSHTVGLLMDLTGAGRQGAGVALTGFTESMDTRKFTVNANDVRHGVNLDNFGLYAHRNEPYKLMEAVNGQLSKWLSARRGKHMRQAVVEQCSDNLETSPTSLSSGWNKNILVKNVADTGQPAYDSTLAQHTANLNQALSDAGLLPRRVKPTEKDKTGLVGYRKEALAAIAAAGERLKKQAEPKPRAPQSRPAAATLPAGGGSRSYDYFAADSKR